MQPQGSRFAVSFSLAALTVIFGAALASPAADPTHGVHKRLPIERHLTLAPQQGNTRNSEGDFVKLTNGHWLFIYTRFTGGAADHARAGLAGRESADGGRTWSRTDRMIVENEGGFNVMSVSLVRLKEGAIALFYLRKNSLQDCRPFMRLSRDEGRTWSEPSECIKDVGYYVLNNSRVVQLESGRLVLPTALHRFDRGRLLPGRIVVFYSDDSGRTWKRSGTELAGDVSGKRVNLMEPGVVEAGPDRLLMVIRTELGRQFLSESIDGGTSWAMPKPSEMLSPEAPATIVRIPRSRDLLAIWNDHAGQTEEYSRSRPPKRTPLSAAVSRDGGRTWNRSMTIEDTPGHGYCYTAVAFEAERVLLAYCAHRSAWGLETTQISSFRMRDLYR